MNLSWRYSIIVQAVTRNGYDTFFGIVPDFGIEIFEVIDAGNNAQEYMFHFKLRRMIEERLTACKVEGKDSPPIRSASSLTYDGNFTAEDIRNYEPSRTEMISTSQAAAELSMHPNTVRSLFDSGVLKGTLTKGGQRFISIVSLNLEKEQMRHRSEVRKFESRAKKKNLNRVLKRKKKKAEEKLGRYQKD
jgi:hypothetical protein